MTDFVDPYLYPGTNVLKNRKGIRDPRQALEFERRLSLLRRRELVHQPIAGEFDLAHLQAIHRHLYQDVWEWAGELRTVEIAKGSSRFHFSSGIAFAFESVVRFLHSSQLLTTDDIPDELFIEQAAELLEKVNYIHPFREGNGRAQRTYLDQIALRSGRVLSWRNISRIDNERASIRAFEAGSGEPLRPLIEEALRPPIDGLSLLDDELYTTFPPDL